MARPAERVLAIVSPKAGWFRQDDELAAHERALRTLGVEPVVLRIPSVDGARDVDAFVERSGASHVWVHGARSFASDVAERLPHLSFVSAAPRGVDTAYLGVVGREPLAAIRGDISVLTASPSPRLRSVLTDLERTHLVQTYGRWSDAHWHEPVGAALVQALQASTLHLVEVAEDGSLPASAFVAAAVEVPLVVLQSGVAQDAFAPRSEVAVASSPEAARAAIDELLAAPSLRRREVAAAARRRVQEDHLLDDGWRSALADRFELRRPRPRLVVAAWHGQVDLDHEALARTLQQLRALRPETELIGAGPDAIEITRRHGVAAVPLGDPVAVDAVLHGAAGLVLSPGSVLQDEELHATGGLAGLLAGPTTGRVPGRWATSTPAVLSLALLAVMRGVPLHLVGLRLAERRDHETVQLLALLLRAATTVTAADPTVTTQLRRLGVAVDATGDDVPAGMLDGVPVEGPVPVLPAGRIRLRSGF